MSSSTDVSGTNQMSDQSMRVGSIEGASNGIEDDKYQSSYSERGLVSILHALPVEVNWVQGVTCGVMDGADAVSWGRRSTRGHTVLRTHEKLDPGLPIDGRWSRAD